MSYKITGIVFIALAGFIYTLERGFSLLSTSIIQAGFFSGQMSGGVPDVETNGFFANLFVPAFLILGIIILIYGFSKIVENK
jgi:hypothetical protein